MAMAIGLAARAELLERTADSLLPLALSSLLLGRPLLQSLPKHPCAFVALSLGTVDIRQQATGYWLLATGYWLLAKARLVLSH